jgi:hypothetical protein
MSHFRGFDTPAPAVWALRKMGVPKFSNYLDDRS